MKNGRLLHYSHCVSDIERSRRFYTDVLGFEVAEEVELDDEKTGGVMQVPGCRFKGVFLQRDGMRIELIGFSQPPPERTARRRATNEIGHSHLSFYVSDLDAEIGELEAKGVPVESRTRVPAGLDTISIRDPDGFLVRLIQTPGLKLVPYER